MDYKYAVICFLVFAVGVITDAWIKHDNEKLKLEFRQLELQAMQMQKPCSK